MIIFNIIGSKRDYNLNYILRFNYSHEYCFLSVASECLRLYCPLRLYYPTNQFRFATWGELLLVALGLILGGCVGLGIPCIIIQYGEFSTMLLDRNRKNDTTTPTTILPWFGGGKIL